METITAAFVRQCLPQRDPEGHKGDFGKVLCICGSVGYTGAPIFCQPGGGAYRGGAGVSGCAPERVARGGSEKRRGDALSFAGNRRR